MKLPCDVIQDLLPLCVDEACSQASRDLVEEHLKGCKACQKAQEGMREAILSPPVEENEERLLAAFRKAWKQEKAQSFRRGILIALGICVILFCLALSFGGNYLFTVPISQMHIEEPYRFANGDIGFIAWPLDGKPVTYIFSTEVNADGTGTERVVISRSLFDLLGFSPAFRSQPRFNLEEVNARRQKDILKGSEIVKCYIGRGKDAILIWELGRELPPAPEEVERAVLPYSPDFN